jgi:hypothetical protein
MSLASGPRPDRPLDYEPELERIRAHVDELCATPRSSAREGERAAARWLGATLDRLGVAEVELCPYRYQHSYALAHGLHNAAALAACLWGGPAGAALAASTLASYELEVSGRSQWLRRLLPSEEGINVLARIPASGRARAVLVLLAHHDAANTGLVWHPRVVAAGARRHLRRRRVDPFMAPLEAALAAGAIGALAPGRAGRLMRAGAAAVLALALAVDADIGRSPTVPGASDNATGVAVCLDIAAWLARSPLTRVEVVVALTGSEEAGMGGMAAVLRRLEGSLDRRRTFLLGLDTLGAGQPIVACAEGAMREQRYRESDLALIREGAALAGEPPPARWRLGAWTDPIVAVHRGLPAASLLSMGPGYFPHYHHPTDLPEHVDWGSVAACARIAAGTVLAFARRVERGSIW